jgi:hypothetical protein
MADVIKVEVLKDGTVRSTTGVVSDANHSTAEEFFQVLAQRLGGESTRTPIEDSEHHHHQHEHGHEHQHG